MEKTSNISYNSLMQICTPYAESAFPSPHFVGMAVIQVESCVLLSYLLSQSPGSSAVAQTDDQGFQIDCLR